MSLISYLWNKVNIPILENMRIPLIVYVKRKNIYNIGGPLRHLELCENAKG